MCKHLYTDEDKAKQMGGFGELPRKGKPNGVRLKMDLSEKVCGLSRHMCEVYGMPGFGDLERAPTLTIIPERCQGQRPGKGKMGPGQPWAGLGGGAEVGQGIQTGRKERYEEHEHLRIPGSR